MSDTPAKTFDSYLRRYATIFVVIVVGIGLMVGCSYSGLAPSVRLALILGLAAVNASLVVCFLMHLVTERKLLLSMLFITALYFVALLVLSTYGYHDVPHLKSGV